MPATGRVLYMRSWMIGCLLGLLLMAFSPLLFPLVPWIFPGAGLLCWWLRHRSFCLGLLAAAVICSWQGHRLLQAQIPEACNGEPLVVIGRVASLPRVTAMNGDRRRQRFEFKLESVSVAECAMPRKLLLSYYGDQALLPGERWQFAVRLRAPWGLSNAGSFNMQAWYAMTGIDGVGSVRSASERRLAGPAPLAYEHHQMRRKIVSAIDTAPLSAAATAVLKAITVADRSDLDHAKWTLLQRFGINHLLVISGLHVALVSGLAYTVGRVFAGLLTVTFPPLGRRPWAECLALLAAVAYTALAGFSVATQRALVMLICFVLARLLSRQGNGFNSLMLAALALLVTNPLAVIGSGFWLSFGAVASLLWMGRWQRGEPGGRLLKPHLFMSVVMLPLGALWFGGGSWVAAPANFVLIPVLGLYVIPLSLTGAGLALIGSERLAAALWQWAAQPIDVLWPLALTASSSADLFVFLPARGLAIGLGLLGTALLLLPLGRVWRPACGLLLLPLLLARAEPNPQPSLAVLDVGQGTAVVYTAGGQSLLYDTGGGNPAGPNMARSVVLPWLRQRGIRALNELVISHGDLDHSAGVNDVVSSYPSTRVWQGESGVIQGRSCLAGLAWQWPDGSRFQFLGPAGPEEGNEASCVLLIDAPGLRVLLPGDISIGQERQLIRYWGERLNSDVLLVAHHGSRTSTSQAWLNRVSPAVAVIGAGYASRFGHPHPQVVQRLENSGVALHQSALEGTIELMAGEAGRWSVTGHREGYKPWWL
jgi:competence protein ComEC